MPDPLDSELFRHIVKEAEVSTQWLFIDVCVFMSNMSNIYSIEFINLQDDERIEEESKSWFELGKGMGVVMVSSEGEEGKEQLEEDKEVEWIYKKGQEMKRKFCKRYVKLVEQSI